MAAYAAFMTNVACGLSASDISSRPLKSSAATGGVCIIRSGVDAEVCNRRTERRPRLNVTSKSRRRPTDKSRELQQHQQQQRQQVLVGRHAACQPCAAAFHLDNWSLLMSCAGARRRIVWRGEATRRRAGPGRTAPASTPIALQYKTSWPGRGAAVRWFLVKPD